MRIPRRIRWIIAFFAAALLFAGYFGRTAYLQYTRARLSQPLVEGASRGDYPKVKALLDQGSDPNARVDRNPGSARTLGEFVSLGKASREAS